MQTANLLSRAGISRPLVVPARHGLFLQKVFDCHLTATCCSKTQSGVKFYNFKEKTLLLYTMGLDVENIMLAFNKSLYSLKRKQMQKSD